jgi:FixJ family two-component response regulator
MSARPVCVVDDDDAVRDALGMLLRTAGFEVESYPSAAALLARPQLHTAGCMVLDIRMPGMSGTALHDELIARGCRVPMIFLTGHGDVPMAVAAMKKGAFDFVEKPFDDHFLIGRVREALEEGGAPRPSEPAAFARLSGREREVLERVLAGKPSRQIAEELFISVKTIEFHRARIMQKLGVRSAAELFRVCLAPAAAKRAENR